MTQRLVVTGASGFIGRHVVAGALGAGFSVMALVRPGSKSNQFASRPGLTVESWDASKDAPESDLFAGANAVCHLAAFYPPDMNSTLYAEECLQTNALGTLRLLETIRSLPVHLVNVSAGQLYSRRGRLAREADSIWPSSHAVYYLSSKLLAELYVDHYVQDYGLAATTLRVGSVYGPGMHSGAVDRFITLARSGNPIEVQENNHYAVDLVYVADVVRAVLSAVEHKPGGVFNIGSGAATGIPELAAAVLTACDVPQSLIRRTPGHDERMGFDGLDIERARSVLGFEPTSLDVGLRATAEGYSPD